MKKKDIQMIFEDPITQRKPEGLARLLKKICNNKKTERWRVCFLSDNFITERNIYNP